MPTIVTEGYGAVSIPAGISDLHAFRQWVHFADLPEKLPVHFLRGDVWVDCDRADSLANVLIRGELTAVLLPLVRVAGGFFALAGVLWSNDRAGFATLPDALLALGASRKAGRIRFSNGGNPKAEATEIIGSPDVVIEIVSEVSEEKDTDWLMSAYFKAEVTEYWLIDARKNKLQFDIYKRGKKEFAAVRKSSGWVKSAVLGKSFRLTQSEGEDGNPEFTLEVR
jgi:hypothetical protein